MLQHTQTPKLKAMNKIQIIDLKTNIKCVNLTKKGNALNPVILGRQEILIEARGLVTIVASSFILACESCESIENDVPQVFARYKRMFKWSR
ncbi:unnamed protein product [Rhizophagus irregularis]|nr:unnamed protein product [Rhizophagus irregularis]